MLNEVRHDVDEDLAFPFSHEIEDLHVPKILPMMVDMFILHVFRNVGLFQ